MSTTQPDPPDTSTLNTKVEEDFVSPLTAIRGALEILRDYPDLESDRRLRFIENALGECARLERGVTELATAVYAAARRVAPEAETEEPARPEFADRILVLADLDTIEVDFSDYEFSDSNKVNAFFDAIEATVQPTNRRWYFMTNFRNCSVWPEAWVAFAHRGKKIRVNHALGAVRYAETPEGEHHARSGTYEPDLCDSREEALEAIGRMKSTGKTQS